MKKIGIITLFGYNNYGNRLQMYAVQKTYGDLGYDTEIIRYKQDGPKDSLIIQMKVLLNKLFNLKSVLYQSNLKRKRISNFRKHAKKYYNESESYVNPLKIDETFHEKYSYLSVGSDQIWGWFTHSISQFVFLKFAPADKRISFSPSFGSAVIEERYKKIFADGLTNFNYISVREQTGADIVKDFTGKTATVLCDPTMCLSKEEWLSFSSIHKNKPNRKFVLTYFLGEPSPQAIELLNKLSTNFQIVHLNSLKFPMFYAVTPSEWIDYINSAEAFLTDSFHGIVFSLVLQTPFAAFNRAGGEAMQTRITNVLEKFKMKDRFEMLAQIESLFTIDFSEVDQIIHNEKINALTFLKKSLNI